MSNSDKDTGISHAMLSALTHNDHKNFTVAATPGGIEAQEKKGQGLFVNSELLPIEFNSGTLAELEQMGVRYGHAVNDLFCHVELPAGWKKVALGHSLWSKLVDEKGRERASIYYKAAFYDRCAFINVNRRFQVSSYEACDSEGRFVEEGDDNTHWATVVLDGGKTLQVFGIRSERSADNKEQNAKAMALREEHKEAAYAWLNEHHPKWQDRTSYWDDVTPAPPANPDPAAGDSGG